MAIYYINTGTSANAGNGDSIRLAFTKVNNNFEDLLGRLDNAQFPNIYVNNGYFRTISNTGTFTTLNLVSTGTAIFNDLSILGNVNGTVNFTDTSTFVNITVTDTATIDQVVSQGLTVANTATFSSDIVVNGNYIGTLNLAGTSTFDNIVVNNTATLNDLTIAGTVNAGFYQGFDDFNIIKDDTDGLHFRLRNIHSDSFTEYNLLDNINGGLTIAHQNSTNDSGRYLSGQNYIYGLTPTDTMNIGRYSDIKFYANSDKYYNPSVDSIPSIVITAADSLVRFGSDTIYLNDISFQVATDGSALVNGIPLQGGAGTGNFVFTASQVSVSNNSDITLVTNANTWTFAADGVLTAPGHLLPDANLAYDLGSTTTQWRSIYVGTGTIFIGGVALGVNADNYVTVDGNPLITINTSGNLTIQGDVNIGTVQISDTAPTATTGTQWFDTVEGRTYVATGGVWLDASPTQIPSPETYLDNIEIDGNNIILPPGGDILDSNGVSVLGATTSTTANGWQLTSSTAVVSLGSTGTLTLPQGGVISEVTVNSEYGILLTPSPISGANPDMAVKIYPTFNDDDHIHITAGNPATVDLFLGDDDQYVKIEADGGNIVVGVPNADNSATSQTWTFGTHGELEFPQGSTISETIGTTIIQAGINRDFLLKTEDYVNSTIRTWTFGTDGVLTLSTASTILGNSTDPNVYIETATTGTTSTWTFGVDGSLTLPAGGTIEGYYRPPIGTKVLVPLNALGDNVNYSPGFLPNPINSSTNLIAAGWNIVDKDGLTAVVTDMFYADDLPPNNRVVYSGTLGSNPYPITFTSPDYVADVTSNITIVATTTGSNNSTWTFGTDGSLTFPDATLQTTAYTGVLVPADGDGVSGNANMVFYAGTDWYNTSKVTINPTSSMLTLNGNSGTGGITFPDATVQTTAFTTSSYISKETLKSIVADSTDFANFQTRIAAL